MKDKQIMPVRIILLFLFCYCLPVSVNAGGPEEEFWFNYDQPLPYNPERINRDTDLQIYNSLIASFAIENVLEKVSISDVKQFVDSLNRASSVLGRSIIFTSTPIDKSNVAHTLEITSKALTFNREIDEYNDYGWGRCGSSSFNNVALLYRLISEDDELPDQALLTWLSHRIDILQSCNKQESLQLLKFNKEFQTHPSFIYLKAVKLFYLEQFNDAALHFQKVAELDNKKLKAIGLYMQARSYLSQARANWRNDHDYGDKVIDSGDFKLAFSTFEKFIQLYPNHEFSTSARGQLRHIHWVRSEEKEYRVMLESEIVALFTKFDTAKLFTNNDNREMMSLLEEYANHVDKQYSALTPVFKAFESQLIHKPKSVTLSFIERLNRFKKAQQYYLEKKYTNVNELFTSHDKLTSLEKILVALNYEALGNDKRALDLWQKIHIPGYHIALQNHMVNNIIANQGLAALFESTIDLDDDIINLSLVRVCSIDKLYEVLLKVDNSPQKWKVVEEVTRRLLTNDDIDTLFKFLSQFSGELPFHIATFKHAAKLIVVDKDLGQGYLIIARNMQYNLRRFSHDYYISDLSTDLGGKEDCPLLSHRNNTKDPYYFYQKGLNSFDVGKSDFEAKTLHSLVTCFKSLDFDNSCRWSWEDDENPSKTWFKKLHKKYKGSYWANKTPYHY
jgi:tetratricopeptide (TPR) repeat protein